ncbi:MAG TPA: nuclear transport factor 2 family protein [Solirubrobacteraceae bacterium]
MSDDLVGLVRGGFEAASRGDVDAIAGMLAPDVRWHGAGDDTGGCQNRKQALRWMREAIERGVAVELLDARELSGDRVALVLRRRPSSDDPEPPRPHGEIISFRDGLITEMVVYPTVEEALAAAG